MDANTAEGLGTCERGEEDRKRRHAALSDNHLQPQKQQDNASNN